MVQPRWKSVSFFALFVLPALALYGLFFLYPFAQGIRISFTNWDGLTPRIPIVLAKEDFESKILDRFRVRRTARFSFPSTTLIKRTTNTKDTRQRA